MAETTLLSPVINKLVDLLRVEVNSLTGVDREVENLKKELEIIQSFLKDANERLERGRMSHALKTWVRHVMEIGDRIEDVIDGYFYFLARRRHRHGFRATLSKAGDWVNALKPRKYSASEIEKINESLCKIKDRAERYGLRPLEQAGPSSETLGEAISDPRLDSLFVEEDELVGIDSMVEELKRRLLNEGASDRFVVSLVGEAGIGETTLAKKVYDDAVVKGHFDCRAWITTSQSSQSYNTEKLLKILARQIFPKEKHAMGEIDTIEELIDPLRQYLKTRRYVLIFDDVWQKDFWDVMKHALPSNNKGSRIIITTRNFAIAMSCKETPIDFVQELQSWPPKLAWELFCKKAFRYEFQGHCPQELEELSCEIVAKCQGLPLVISAIGGLLSSKEKVDSQWRRVLDNLSYEFKLNPQLTSISKILSHSYHDLPYHLKSCFLYFGIFPEDYSIHEKTLYKLWIAEGFVKEKQDMTLEQVAEEYLNELIQRNLVAFEVRYGVYRWCRVHDLMHNIILSKVDELCFCLILDEKKLTPRKNYRRLSIFTIPKNIEEISKDHFAVHSISFLMLMN